MLTPSLATLRLFLHVLSASVWVGGQLIMLGVVPSLRVVDQAHDGLNVVRAAANGFAKVAWPAYVVAFVTGMWNLFEVPTGAPAAYHATLGVKILLVVAAGVAAAVHSRAASTKVIAATGAIGLIASLAALFLGELLTTSA